jgi:hypothetical protein
MALVISNDVALHSSIAASFASLCHRRPLVGGPQRSPWLSHSRNVRRPLLRALRTFDEQHWGFSISGINLPLGQVRPGSRLLETERKLLTHAIRMSAYNAESPSPDAMTALRPRRRRSPRPAA